MSLTDRQVQTTDYTRISGANYSASNNNLSNGYYWTRSPIETIEDNDTLVSRCNMNGTLNNFVGWSRSCIEPYITISL